MGVAIAIWFYRHPDSHYRPEREGRAVPLTDHERKMNYHRSKQDELNSMGLSGFWVDRRYFGRFKGPRD